MSYYPQPCFAYPYVDPAYGQQPVYTIDEKRRNGPRRIPYRSFSTGARTAGSLGGVGVGTAGLFAGLAMALAGGPLGLAVAPIVAGALAGGALIASGGVTGHAIDAVGGRYERSQREYERQAREQARIQREYERQTLVMRQPFQTQIGALHLRQPRENEHHQRAAERQAQREAEYQQRLAQREAEKQTREAEWQAFVQEKQSILKTALLQNGVKAVVSAAVIGRSKAVVEVPVDSNIDRELYAYVEAQVAMRVEIVRVRFCDLCGRKMVGARARLQVCNACGRQLEWEPEPAKEELQPSVTDTLEDILIGPFDESMKEDYLLGESLKLLENLIREGEEIEKVLAKQEAPPLQAEELQPPTIDIEMKEQLISGDDTAPQIDPEVVELEKQIDEVTRIQDPVTPEDYQERMQAETAELELKPDQFTTRLVKRSPPSDEPSEKNAPTHKSEVTATPLIEREIMKFRPEPAPESKITTKLEDSGQMQGHGFIEVGASVVVTEGPFGGWRGVVKLINKSKRLATLEQVLPVEAEADSPIGNSTIKIPVEFLRLP